LIFNVDVSFEVCLSSDVRMVGDQLAACLLNLKLHGLLYALAFGFHQLLNKRVSVPLMAQCRLAGRPEEVRIRRPLQVQQSLATAVEYITPHILYHWYNLKIHLNLPAL